MNPSLGSFKQKTQPPLWAKVRGWAVALTSVAMLVGLVDSRSDIRDGLLIGIAVTEAVVPLALTILAVMMVSAMALMCWTRNPSRALVIRSGLAMCLCTLSMAAGLIVLKHLTGASRVAGTILYLGLGVAGLLFMEVVVPVWQDRGFLRHPKVGPDLKHSADCP